MDRRDPRHGRAGRVRAADPPAGGHDRRARADAPPRRARHRAPARRRHPRGGGRGRARRGASCAAGCAPSASARQRRGAGVRARRPRGGRGRARGSLGRGGRAGAGRNAATGCCARSSTAPPTTRWSSAARRAPTLAARARRRARGGQPARPPSSTLKRALPRGPLRARGNRDARRPRARRLLVADLGALQFLLVGAGRRGAAPVLRQRAGADRERRGRVRRRAAALAGGVRRAQRPVGARRARALLPPAHAALPDPAGRAAHRARPLERARPHRVLAGAEGTGALVPDERRRAGSRRHDRPGDRQRPRRVGRSVRR